MIAETRDLGTRFAKMVVTDDHGRYVLPDLPAASYQVWVRGYGLVDSPKIASAPGKESRPDRRGGAQSRRRGAILSGDLLVRDDPGSRPRQVSGHRSQRQRHPGPVQDPGSMAERGQDQWLRQLSPDRQLRDPDHSGGARPFRHLDRGMGAAPAIGAGRPDHDRQHGAPADAGRRPSGGAGGLDGSHQGRRAAERDAAAADRRRAQCRGDGAGLVGSQALPARPDAHRQTRSDRQRLRIDLRGGRALHRQPAGPRSGAQHQDRHEGTGARSEGNAELGLGQSGAGAFALLGNRANLGHAGQRAQSDDGPGRPGLFHGAAALAEGSAGLLQAQFAAALGPALPACRNARRLRPERAAGHRL